MSRFRTGHRVPLNVYDGDRPIFQAHSEQDAERLTELLNAGLDAERYRLALVAVVDEDSAGFGCSNSTSLRSACRTPHSGRTPLSGEGATSWCPSCIATDALESIDPRDIKRSAGLPTGQPADDSGPQRPHVDGICDFCHDEPAVRTITSPLGAARLSLCNRCFP